MKYWVFIDGRQQGPYTLEQLYDLPVDRNTRVWFEGLPRWATMGEIEELNCLFPESEAPAQPESVVIEQETVGVTDDGTVFVAQGPVVAAVRPAPAEPAPATYLGWTIFLVLCCCSPLSIAALVGSIVTSSYYSKGDIAKSRKASEVTAWLVMISFALGMLPCIAFSCLF